MMQMWIEGGWGMFPVLVFGLITMFAAGRYAIDGQTPRLRFVAAMSGVLVVSMAHSMLTNVAADTPLCVRHTGVASTQAGQAHLELEYAVMDD